MCSLDKDNLVILVKRKSIFKNIQPKRILLQKVVKKSSFENPSKVLDINNTQVISLFLIIKINN